MKVQYLLALFITLLLTATSCEKNKEKLIVGTWEIDHTKVENLDQYLSQFKDTYQANDQEIEREKSRIESMPEAYYPSGITMTFEQGGKYDFGGIGGKWNYDKATNTLKVSLAIGDTTSFEVKQASRNKLVLVYPLKVANGNLRFELVLRRVEQQ